MITDLTPLISRVRLEISDLPIEFCKDPQILFSLRRSLTYVRRVCKDEYKDDNDLLADVVVTLALYYTYRNYLSLTSNRQGTIPEAAPVMLQAYREDAIAFLSMISQYALGKDLIPEIVQDPQAHAIAFTVTKSVIE